MDDDLVDRSDALLARNTAATDAANRANAHDAGTNRHYKSIKNRYKKFVDNYADCQAFQLPDGEYINQLALKTYFIEVEQKKDCQPKNAMRSVNALNAFVQKEGKLCLLGSDETSKNASLDYSPLKQTIATCLETVAITYNRFHKELF